MKLLATGFLCLCLAAGFAPSASAGVDLTAYDVTGCMTLNFNQTCYIQMYNDTGVAVDIWWLDTTGAEVFIATLPAGINTRLDTWLTHPFVARRHSDQVALEGFTGVTGSSLPTPDLDTIHILGSTGPFPRLCPPIATESTTWGGIKSLYRN